MSKTILIVDDEPLNRMFLRTILEYDGHTVLEAGNALSAIEAARNEPPDLMIMDLHMPGIDGSELLKRLRNNHEFTKMRVALYTATAVDRAMRDFMEANNILFTIPKPADPQIVLQIVRQALS